MNTAMLKGIIVQNGDTQEKLAKEMGIAQSALSARINGKTEIKTKDIVFFRERYGLSDEMTALIFFDDEVSKKETSRGA